MTTSHAYSSLSAAIRGYPRLITQTYPPIRAYPRLSTPSVLAPSGSSANWRAASAMVRRRSSAEAKV